MGKIVWLASYPKSGNTWVRMFLNSYFKGQEEKQDLNTLDLSTFGGSSKTSYRAVTSKNVDSLSDAEIMALTPLAHSHIAAQKPNEVFVKTHNLLSTYYDIPLITPTVTASGLYIIRNPLDLVLSVADHFGLTVDKAIDFISNPNGSTAPTETMVRQIFCSWTENVKSWSENPPFPVFVVRYEDLHATPIDMFSEILSFLGTQPDVKQVQKAAKQCSFKALRQMEKRDGFTEKSQHSKSFFRVGKTGQWKSKLTETQIERIIRPNYAQMKRFGYLPDGY
ncbi:sulfotransferase domain-containing protein [Sneathiella aquimaris]|uniref:sulfotransferase domain-containing protein n=1 Tax=Sneathiella aquimaris TaxID=2599305 RepID=UPI00146CDFB5|nr:sulfotransferase domain-containing protein [Sneathiella aquimaris]